MSGTMMVDYRSALGQNIRKTAIIKRTQTLRVQILLSSTHNRMADSYTYSKSMRLHFEQYLF